MTNDDTVSAFMRSVITDTVEIYHVGWFIIMTLSFT